MSGYPDHLDSPGQLARIKREPESEESRPAPPTQFTMDQQPQRASPWPYYERNFSQQLDQLLAESRSLLSPSSSAAAAVQHAPMASQPYTAPVSGQSQMTAMGSAAQNVPGDLVKTDSNTARNSDNAGQGPGTQREGPSLARDAPNPGVFDRDLPEEGELVPSARLPPSTGQENHAMGGDVAHDSGSGSFDAEQDAETVREVGKALMDLNNGAQNKSYRRAIDVYKEVKTGDWYGTVYIGPKSTKLKRPEKSVAQAKIKLVSLGLQLLKSMPKASLDMLNHFPQPPASPPPGFERPSGTTFSRGPKVPAGSNNPPPPTQPASSTTGQITRAGSTIQAANDNFVGLLGEWANLNQQYQRPQFETRVVAGVAKATVYLQLNRDEMQFSSLSRLAENEDASEPGNASRLATQTAKQKAAEQAIRWLVSQRYITRIDPDGHIRRSNKRPGPEPLPEPPTKHAKGANATPVSTSYPAAKPQSSSLVLRKTDHVPRSGTGWGQSAFSPPSGPRQITGVTSGETARPPPLNAPTGPSRGSGGNTPNDPSRSSRAQSLSTGKSYSQACELLADALRLGPAVFYWMPVDPVRAPDAAFNCSAHLKGHVENGILGGAVAELRNLRVSTGATEAKEAIAKELYGWLSAKREEKRLQLQEQMRELGDASLI